MKQLAWFLLLVSAGVYAQKPGSVQWSLTQSHAAHNDERTLMLHADIEKGWHIYALTQQAGGPLPLVLRTEPDSPYQISGPIKGTQPQKHLDSSFNLTTEYFTDVFSLEIPVKQIATSQASSVPLAVRFQMCSNTTCMPPRTVHLVAKDNTL